MRRTGGGRECCVCGVAGPDAVHSTTCSLRVALREDEAERRQDEMTTLTIPDLADEVVRHFEERARENHRTLEQEVRARLESDVRKTPEEAERFLEQVRRIREAFTEFEITDEFLEKAKNWGRP